MAKDADQGPIPQHGARLLPSVQVDSYNLEIEDGDGFLGDRANKGAFRRMLDEARALLGGDGDDPLGAKDSDDISKKKLEELLSTGEPEAAAVIQSAIETFSRELALVIQWFLCQQSWRNTECIVFGGGFREGRIGELAIARTGMLLKEARIDVAFELLHNDPDEAGLIGGAHLVPPWVLKGHDGLLTVDVGGTNIRAGLVELNLDKKPDLSRAGIRSMKLWRHADDDVRRDEAVERLCSLLKDLMKEAKKSKVRLAPIIGVGCPGVVREDGAIDRGAQNLPGNWSSSKFNLARDLRKAIPVIDESETHVVIHNDAVVQGLSELPHLARFKHWAILTIGTGLGNARFTTRETKRKRC